MKFYGAVVKTKWDRTWPFRKLWLLEGGISIQGTWISEGLQFSTEAPLEIWIERIRVPFFWRTIVWFKGAEEHATSSTVGFIPFRTKAFIRALTSAGLDVRRS